jgi:hypothetical protein
VQAELEAQLAEENHTLRQRLTAAGARGREQMQLDADVEATRAAHALRAKALKAEVRSLPAYNHPVT